MVWYPTTLGPSGDNSGITDTKNIQQAIRTGQQLNEGTYYVNATLLLDTGQVFAGSGIGTVINAVSGFSGASMVALKTPASSNQVTVRDMTLVPNTGTVGGVYLDNTGYSTDSRHILRNVYVNTPQGDGFRFGAVIRSMTVIGCQVYGGEAYGFNIGVGTTDNFFIGCVSGPTKNHGFYVNDGNNHFSACKAFFSGFDTNLSAWGTTQAGFYLNGVSRTILTGCTAEQAALNGFDLQSCSFVAMTGCCANNNSAGALVTTGVGINLNANLNCIISSNSGNNNGGISPGTQLWGYQAAGTQNNTLILGNTVTGASGLFNYVSGGGYVIMDTNSVQLGGVAQFTSPAPQLTAGSVQPLSNNSTITLNFPYSGVLPVSETGNVTGIILAAGVSGLTVTIVNRSAFTITFAASGTSHVADGASDVIPALTARTFTYDSGTSLWYRVA